MGRLAIVALGFFALLFVVGGTLVTTFIGTNNTLVAQEEGIKAQYNQNRNNYDNYFKKLLEASQVSKAYANDLKAIYTDALKGRYGANGSQAVFQFIQEQNPNVDASMYRQLQQIIEAGRNSFEADQKSLLDKKRVYETQLRVFPTNFIAGFMGFPKIDLAKYDIVTSAETEKAFEEKKADPIQVFK